MKKTKSEKSNNIRKFDVYYKSHVDKSLTWCNSFVSIFKDNKRAAKYWVKKMQEKEPSYEFIIIERD